MLCRLTRQALAGCKIEVIGEHIVLFLITLLNEHVRKARSATHCKLQQKLVSSEMHSFVHSWSACEHSSCRLDECHTDDQIFAAKIAQLLNT